MTKVNEARSRVPRMSAH